MSSRDALLDRALETATELCRFAMVCGQEAVSWPSEQPRPGLRPRPLGPQLYDGTSGIALFLANARHYAAVAGSPEEALLAQRVLAALAPLRSKLRRLIATPEKAASLHLGVGGFTGLGSMIYAMARVGDLLQRPDLVADAGAVALELLTKERIQQDRCYDFMAGTAGALCSLLALHKILRFSPSNLRDSNDGNADRILDRALFCGEHLLAGQQDSGGWPGVDRPALSGFAHGAAGIGYALQRLGATVHDRRFEAAARAGFKFERSLFLPDEGTWFDPRHGRPLEQSAWCHGAPGVWLGRLGVREWTEDSDLEASKELETYQDLTLNLPAKEVDHLCCGNAGQIEILMLASARLKAPELADRALELAASVLDRGPRFVISSDDQETHFSMALGLAGWGNCLLQLACGGTLPSPLLLES